MNIVLSTVQSMKINCTRQNIIWKSQIWKTHRKSDLSEKFSSIFFFLEQPLIHCNPWIVNIFLPENKAVKKKFNVCFTLCFDLLGRGTWLGTEVETGEGTGVGTEVGTGEGTWEGTGEGTGVGPGEGTGEDTGVRTGEGTGEGTGVETGEGTRDGTGVETGEGTGVGTGEGTGVGTGECTGVGTGEGTGLGVGGGTTVYVLLRFKRAAEILNHMSLNMTNSHAINRIH